MRYWSGPNPRELHEQLLHAEHVTFWSALSRAGIIGPGFFKEYDKAITVTFDLISRWLENFFFPSLKKRIWGMSVSNKTAPQLTRHQHQWLSWASISLNVLHLWGVILNGQHPRSRVLLPWLDVSFRYIATYFWRNRNYHLFLLKISKQADFLVSRIHYLSILIFTVEENCLLFAVSRI